MGKSLNDLLYDLKRIEEHRLELSDEKIKSIYKQLIKDLDHFLADTYKKYADDDGRLYINYLDKQRAKAAFLQQIADNIDNIMPEVRNQINELVTATYEGCYKGMLEAAKKAYSDTEFEKLFADVDVNPSQLKAAFDNSISKLTLPTVLENHRTQIIYQIQYELVAGLINGDRYEKMAKRIEERVGVSQSKAMNTTRTEMHRNSEGGFLDCAERLSEKLEGSGYIYAATWQTMEDERVRPQQRRKTKKGWVTTLSKNGANHMKMNGVTVKVGEFFDLGDGVKAKAPGQSGVAAHDCRCRCILVFNLMTIKEFAEATGLTEEEVKERYI